MAQLDQIINHIRNRPYMDGISRDKLRVKATGEVFTPTWLVRKLLDQLERFEPKRFDGIVIDPACGDGQFLGEVLIRKLQKGIIFEDALASIRGVDIMPDNVKLCRDRLLCGRSDLQFIVDNNIRCTDGLNNPFAYRFDLTVNDCEALFQEHLRMQTKNTVVETTEASYFGGPMEKVKKVKKEPPKTVEVEEDWTKII